MSSWPVPKYTVEEYLAIDEASDVRNEYLSGYIVAMATNTPEHGRIVDNLIRHLGNLFDDGPCQTFSQSQRVKASESAYLLPDVMVTCGPPEYLPTRPKTLTNPLVIIEVLSDTTMNADYGDKFLSYRKLDSLRHYVLVAQDKASIDIYTPQPNGHLDLVNISGLESILELPAVDVSLPLSLIYKGVEFPVELEISE